MMKVLHVRNIAQVGSNLVAGLNAIGIEADLYETISLRKLNAPAIVKKTLSLPVSIFEAIRFWRRVKKGKYNVVHIHFAPTAYLALFTRIPFYLHIHGTDIREMLSRPITGNIVRWGIRSAKRVFFTTPDLEVLIKPLRSDALFLPNPIDTTQFYPSDSYPDVDLFSISKLDRYKGVCELLDTIGQLKAEKPDIRIAFFAHGNALGDVSGRVNELSAQPNMVALGPVSHDGMASLINRSRVILGQMGTGILTLSELEAMACAKPVVCKFFFDAIYPSPPPVISVRNAFEAASAVTDLLNDSQHAASIGAEAFRWVQENYDIKSVAKKLIAVYEESTR